MITAGPAVRIASCTRADLDHLLADDPPRGLAHHLRERFALQAGGEGVFLLAWRGAANVGRATLYDRSKYHAVRAAHPRAAEINALEAHPTGVGTGTALIAAAEAASVRRGHDRIGLAVEPGNPAARRLYDRLGYIEWAGGNVVDEWLAMHPDGTDVVHHDVCDYLLKRLPRG